jgi:hypothetical protein
MYCFARSGICNKSYSAAGSSSVEIQCWNVRWHFTSRDPVAGLAAADLRCRVRGICWLHSCRGLRSRRDRGVLTLFPEPLSKKDCGRDEMCRIWKTVAGKAVISGWKRCYTPCRGMYLHLRRRPMSRTDAPPYLPGASHLYGEEAKEVALAPVGLARHRTKWPCDQVGPPGPPPVHPSCPLDPQGAGWGETSALLAA